MTANGKQPRTHLVFQRSDRLFMGVKITRVANWTVLKCAEGVPGACFGFCGFVCCEGGE